MPLLPSKQLNLESAALSGAMAQAWWHTWHGGMTEGSYNPQPPCCSTHSGLHPHVATHLVGLWFREWFLCVVSSSSTTRCSSSTTRCNNSMTRQLTILGRHCQSPQPQTRVAFLARLEELGTDLLPDRLDLIGVARVDLVLTRAAWP